MVLRICDTVPAADASASAITRRIDSVMARTMMSRVLGGVVALIGFIGAIVTILDASDPLRKLAFWVSGACVALLLAMLAVPGAIRAYRARQSLPSDKDLEDRCAGYQLQQADPTDIAWIAHLEASVYSREDAIPERTLDEWYAVNPAGFSIVRSPSGKRIGHLDVLPLRPSTLKAFCKGDIVEKDIRGDSLFSADERHLVTILYVESIILQPERPLTAASAMMCVLKSLPTLIRRVADPNVVQSVYAIAATPAGERLLRKLGFVLECSGERRTDRHNLFCAPFAALVKEAARFSGDSELTRDLRAGI